MRVREIRNTMRRIVGDYVEGETVDCTQLAEAVIRELCITEDNEEDVFDAAVDIAQWYEAALTAE